MAIDITNKEEKQIALTGAEIEETLLQAHLSKEAIGKIEGLEASASEIDGNCSIPQNTIIIDGDSIAGLTSTTWATILSGGTSSGAFIWGNVMLNGYFKLVAEVGVGGERTDQLLSRLTDSLIIDGKYIHFIIGKNDVEQGIDTSVTIANLEEIFRQSIKAGKIVVASTIIPGSNDTDLESQKIITINKWIKNQRSVLKNFIVVDYYKAMINKTTGLAKINYTYDGIHPSSVGAYYMGKEFKTELALFASGSNHLLPTSNANDSTQLLTNNLFINNSSGLATGYGKTGTYCTASIDETGEYIKQVLTITSSASASSFYYNNTTADFTSLIGESIFGAIEYEITEVTNIEYFDFWIECRTGSTVILAKYAIHQLAGQGITFEDEKSKGVLVTTDLIIPTGTNRIMCWFETKMVGTIKLSRPTVEVRQ